MNYNVISDNYILKEYKINNDMPKEYIGDWENKKCRFCRRTEIDGATFRKIAHAIPQLLGNNRLFSNEECDECNEKFGYLENDLGMYLLPIRAMYNISGKRKNNCKNGGLNILNKDGTTIVEDIIDENKIPIYSTFNDEKKEVTFKIKRSGYKKINVFKSMVKMALSIIPIDTFYKLKIYQQLLNGKFDKVPNMVIKETFIPGMNKNNKLVVRYGVLKSSSPDSNQIQIPLVIFTIRLCGYQYAINLYEKNFYGFNVARIDFKPELDQFHYIHRLKDTSYGWYFFESDIIEKNKYMYMTLSYGEKNIINDTNFISKLKS